MGTFREAVMVVLIMAAGVIGFIGGHEAGERKGRSWPMPSDYNCITFEINPGEPFLKCWHDEYAFTLPLRKDGPEEEGGAQWKK